MPTSWTQNLYHAVFATERRTEIITPDLEERLYPFIGGILKDLGCAPLAINGTADHIHFLARYPSSLSNADMVRNVKQRSSAWIHDTFPEFRHFGRQRGYGGFTVSKSLSEEVAQYIRNQKVHHKKYSALDEFKEMLRRNEMEFDPALLE
jgi:putative transposase